MAEKQGYAQPMVVVGQTAQVEVDYTVPRAKVPAIIMLVIAFINFIAFITLGIMTGQFTGSIEFIISFLLYGLVGALAAIAGFRKQTGQACATAMIVFAVFALILSFVQIIIRALAVLGGAILVSVKDNDYAQVLGTVVLIISGLTLFFAILVFILSIILIVFGSKVVCQCCGAPTQASGGVVYQAAPSAPMQA